MNVCLVIAGDFLAGVIVGLCILVIRGTRWDSDEKATTLPVEASSQEDDDKHSRSRSAKQYLTADVVFNSKAHLMSRRVGLAMLTVYLQLAILVLTWGRSKASITIACTYNSHLIFRGMVHLSQVTRHCYWMREATLHLQTSQQLLLCRDLFGPVCVLVHLSVRNFGRMSSVQRQESNTGPILM
jgi:hypothetical protein